jgi:hypothetical protein
MRPMTPTFRLPPLTFRPSGAGAAEVLTPKQELPPPLAFDNLAVGKAAARLPARLKSPDGPYLTVI